MPFLRLHNLVRWELLQPGCGFQKPLTDYRLTIRKLNRDLIAGLPHMGGVHSLRHFIFTNCFQIREKITC